MSATTGVMIDTATILGAAYRYTACRIAVFPAEAGGKNPERLDDSIAAVPSIVEQML